MKQAVGLIEVKGLPTAINIADTMLKVAAVTLIGIEKARGFGWLTVEVTGDVSAVQAAVDAGKAKANESSALVSAIVIARPASNLEKVFFETKKTQQKISSTVPQDEVEAVVPVEVEEIISEVSENKTINDEKITENSVKEEATISSPSTEATGKNEKENKNVTKKKKKQMKNNVDEGGSLNE